MLVGFKKKDLIGAMWTRVNNEIMARSFLVYGVALLLLTSTLGFYSYDFFTLWGMHPKWVWSTGEFFTPGAYLPVTAPYQSVFGSALGWITQQLGLPYFDWSWGVFNCLAIFSGLGLALWLRGGFASATQRIAFILALLLIKPWELRQMTYGGYGDLLGSAFLAISASALWSQRWVIATVGAVGLSFTKPYLWVWPLILAFSFFFAQSWPLRERIKAVATLLIGTLLARAFLQWGYAVPEVGQVIPTSVKLSDYSAGEFARLPLALLTSNHGLVALALIFGWIFRRHSWQWLAYGGGSFAFLIFIYTFVMQRTPSELFASIHRYTLPLFIPPLIFAVTSTDFSRWLQARVRLQKSIFILCGFALFVRTFEEIDLARRFPLTQRPKLCRQGDALCTAIDGLRARMASRKECDVYVVPKDLATSLLKSNDDLLELKLLYGILPLRAYPEKVPLRESYGKACRIDL